MRDPKEAAILRSIAEEGEDNVGRLVLSDLLEERGENARAEFLRVQCELASPDLPEERRRALRVRERALLDAHRREWVQAFGLPLEDVRFERGLIAGMRPIQWEGGRLLDAEHAPWLETLTELDLSGLGLGDDGLTTFAQTANFPALRRLLLNGNEITDVGAAALAAATGLPRLDTLYLFDNRIGARARPALERAAHFRLANLDLGEHPDGYCMSPGETDDARRRYLRTDLLPLVARYFQTYERLQSALLCVAQYWADEADDAVHGSLIVSELPEPSLEGARFRYKKDSSPDVNLPTTRIEGKYGESGSVTSLYGTRWDDNSGAIPLWAAFAPEEGSQEYETLQDAYAPAVRFYRHGGYEFLPMRRPHLNGIRPEWWDGE
jgi:uncharacterized protein (TIGR02996 family)